ncbi:MAG: phosphoglucosamine mutase [Methanocellales archaeon]|nr:phosphoglucosamine mutase [Methanocellales archaeon]
MSWRPTFGTNGVRGIANEELTPEIALKLCLSLGTLCSGDIAIGRDTRVSGEMLKSAAISGLLTTGNKVIDLGITPSPAIQYYVKNNADAGVIVTASHNPKEYNGLKFVDGVGMEFSRDGEKEVEKVYDKGEFKRVKWDRTGELIIADAIPDYKKGIMKLIDVEKVRDKRFRVVVDPGNGAACGVMSSLLRELGCEVIEINAEPDGAFPGRPPEPTADVLGELMAMVKKSGADFGVAHDGDADRAVFVDERGKFVSEDVLLAMFTKSALEKKKGVIVTPVSSSSCVADVVERCSGEIAWTPVGSIHVARKMLELGAVFGGEGNGGLIFPEHQYCRDGGVAAAKMLEILCAGKTLSQLADEIPKYYHIKEKLRGEDKDGVMQKVKGIARGKVDTTDGVKLWYDDGWVLVRASGTEPIIRIFAESKSQKRAKELLQEGIELVKRASG